MICRKDTLGYIDFMRGKYSVSNHKYILNMFKQMTEYEKYKLSTLTFDELWNDLWSSEMNSTHHDDVCVESQKSPQVKLSNSYRQEEINSREKFLYLSRTPVNNIFHSTTDISHLLHDSTSLSVLHHLLMVSNIPDMWKCESNPIPPDGGGWKEPEWGFPKGRRNHSENDYECALREMTEETGFPSSVVKNIKNVLPFDEIFLGSNYKSYKHRYFLMYMDYKDSVSFIPDSFENSEVSRMEWKSYTDCMISIRPYNLEKKRLITNIETALSNYRLFV
jgi:8-oxo-dGTP pyrophosphatase MutT (NUDIX family)